MQTEIMDILKTKQEAERIFSILNAVLFPEDDLVRKICTGCSSAGGT